MKRLRRKLANWLSGGEYSRLQHQVAACSQAAHGIEVMQHDLGYCEAAEEVFALHTVAVRITSEKMLADAKFAEVVRLWNHINANINKNPEKN